MKCSTSSKSIGSRRLSFCALALCLLLIPCGTSSAQALPAPSLSSVSSDDFLQAVKELSDSLTPDQRSKLTTILEHYKAEEQAQNDSLKRLSILWQVEKAKILNDQIWGDIWSGLGGVVGGYVVAKSGH